MICWFNEYFARFASDNNTRANTFLLLVALFGLFWLATFGITPAPAGLSSDDIDFMRALGEETPWLPNWGITEGIKWGGWKFWWLCLGTAIIYRLLAWRDEVHRAWQTTRQHLAEVRQAVHDLTPAGSTPMSAGERLERPFGMSAWLRVFVREFIAAVSGDYLVGRR